ncbi:MAG TPA: hypothetical protein VMS21_14470 [Methylomirabilota bacterium]|nr:hypothetical protein [Methylomirabilota bacterium]
MNCYGYFHLSRRHGYGSVSTFTLPIRNGHQGLSPQPRRILTFSMSPFADCSSVWSDQRRFISPATSVG